MSCLGLNDFVEVRVVICWRALDCNIMCRYRCSASSLESAEALGWAWEQAQTMPYTNWVLAVFFVQLRFLASGNVALRALPKCTLLKVTSKSCWHRDLSSLLLIVCPFPTLQCRFSLRNRSNGLFRSKNSNEREYSGSTASNKYFLLCFESGGFSSGWNFSVKFVI